MNSRKSQSGYDLHDCPSDCGGQLWAMQGRRGATDPTEGCPGPRIRGRYQKRHGRAASKTFTDSEATDAQQAASSCCSPRHPVIPRSTLDESPSFRASNETDLAGGSRSLTSPGPAHDDPSVQGARNSPEGVVSARDQLPNLIGPDGAWDGILRYVGLTRAIDRLAVTWPGGVNSPTGSSGRRRPRPCRVDRPIGGAEGRPSRSGPSPAILLGLPRSGSPFWFVRGARINRSSRASFFFVADGRWKTDPSSGFNSVETRRVASLVFVHFREDPGSKRSSTNWRR
jgi:hypothetical protein